MFLIKNGRIIDPKSGMNKVLDLIIKEGKIFDIGKFEFEMDNNFSKIIDAKNLVISPGLIDVHVHFREPGFEYKEDIFSGSMTAAKGGFTTVICMANTKPVVDNIKTLEYVLAKAKRTKINVLTCGAITTNFDGKNLTDMKRLYEKGAVGFTDDGMPLLNAKVVKEAMEISKELGVPLSFHEEDPVLIGLAGINNGEVSEKLGFTGAPSVSEDVMVARDVMLALETGAKIDIQHISSKNSVELVRLAKKLGANIFAEVTPQHFAATEDLVTLKDTLAKVNPPLRTEEDRKALIKGLQDNTIEIIATDHAPHSAEEKARELSQAPSGMIGLETALALGITKLVKEGHLTLSALIEKMTVNPAKLYDLDAGTLEKGKVADIMIFDEHENWVVSDNFASKSSNSPFIGEKLTGRVKYTICNGEIVYEDSRI